MRNTSKVFAIIAMASAGFFVGRFTQTDRVIAATPAPAPVVVEAAAQPAAAPVTPVTPAVAPATPAIVQPALAEPSSAKPVTPAPQRAVVQTPGSPAGLGFEFEPEEEREELGVPLPSLGGALPAVIRNGKQILPSVTPIFPHQNGGNRVGSGVIDYDPNERSRACEQIVRHARVKGDILETRWQGDGKARRGDKSFLFNTGRTFFGQADTNGHVEGSPTNGVAFNAARRVISGYGVFVTGYVNTRREDGKRVRVALNIVYVLRQGGVILRNPDVWNLREFFVAGNEPFRAMSDTELFENEAEWAGQNNDRSYFALVSVPAGGIVDPIADKARLLKEKKFFSFSEGLPYELVVTSSGKKK